MRFAELRRAWLLSYTAAWVLTFLSAALFASNPAGVDRGVRGLLGATLDAQRNPPPSIGHVLMLLAHNLPLASWSLLLGALGVHRHQFTRQITDVVVAAWFSLNVLTVGIALGVYGAALLPYIPQVPFEWVAVALGASAWLLQRRDPLSVAETVGLFALIVSTLFCSAVLETVAVPYR